MDILCINDKFSTDVLEFYKVHKVVTPKKDSFYVIRNTIRHTTGEIGILLEEIINPKVPVKHPILGVTQMEPSWNSNRFVHLDGTPILEEELKEYFLDNATKCLKHDLVAVNN